MRVLGLETSGEFGSAAIVENGALRSECNFEATLKHGERLFPAIDAALGLSGMEKADLELIAIAIGPGSFTGLRIGISSARGLAQALGIPLVGVPSADGYRSTTLGLYEKIEVLLPDRQQWLYVTEYILDDQQGAVRVDSIDEFVRRMSDPNEIMLVGPGAEIHRERFESEGLDVAQVNFNHPSAHAIARLGEVTFKMTGSDELFEIEPVYLQPPVANASKSR